MPEEVDAYHDMLRTENMLYVLVTLARSIDFDNYSEYLERIPQISQKTLVIWGEEDVWIPVENGQRFKNDIKDARLVVIPGCGHMPQEELPEQTARLVLDFLEDPVP